MLIYIYANKHDNNSTETEGKRKNIDLRVLLYSDVCVDGIGLSSSSEKREREVEKIGSISPLSIHVAANIFVSSGRLYSRARGAAESKLSTHIKAAPN